MNSKRELTYRELLQDVSRKLADAEVEEWKEDAWQLFSFSFGINRSNYFLQEEESLSQEHKELLPLLEERVQKRTNCIPIQYILGKQEFMGLEFLVNEHVLIPRFDTELLVEEVCRCSAGKEILDVCTGSGCIAVSIAMLGNPLKVDALDSSLEALAVAEENGKKHGAKVHFFQSDLLDGCKEQYDCIVSNPPYIATEEILTLAKEVREREPSLALDGGADGLDFYRRLIPQAKEHLRNEGRLFLEIGCEQGDAVSCILQENGYTQIQVKKDYAGLDRIVTAQKACA